MKKSQGRHLKIKDCSACGKNHKLQTIIKNGEEYFFCSGTKVIIVDVKDFEDEKYHG